MRILSGARLIGVAGGRVEIAVDGGRLLLDCGRSVARVLLVPAAGLATPRTWSLDPGDGVPEPLAGRDRLAPALPPVAVVVEETDAAIVVTTAGWRAEIGRAPVAIRWQEAIDGGFRTVLTDRPTAAYRLPRRGSGFRHALVLDPREHYCGFGETAGDTDKRGRKLEMATSDSLGYDARITEPLYKHIPYYATVRPDEGGRAVGLFYDCLARGRFDLGREIDAYHGLFRSFEADHGDLDYYVVFGPSLAAVTRRFTRLTGRAAFQPRWSIPYSGSTMSYTDDADPPARFAEFLGLLKTHDLPCASFHLSSGYTMIGDNRYVFNWNRDRFPDPQGFAATMAAAGIRLVANIKPALLADHPRFAEVEAFRGFVRDADDPAKPHMTQFWGGLGAYLDFTNRDTSAWWQARVTDALLEMGIAATWNDNNEFEVWDDEAPVALDGLGGTMAAMRPVETQLMLRASALAQKAYRPGKRPYLVTRSGGPGLQRYVQTWTGDNRTEWQTLRYNLRMGHGLTLSGIANFGHDVGGFAGPKPEPELFVRWVEQGIFWPRFSIHSWNDDATANEPWMYPEVLPAIRACLKLRERLVPYLYTVLYRVHADYAPALSPLFLAYPDDPGAYAEDDSFLLGDALLVAPVVEPGVTERRVRLPDHPGGWYDFWTGAAVAGGGTVTAAAPLGRAPVFVAAGTILPLGPERSEETGDLVLRVYPGPDGARLFLYDDDGDSVPAPEGIALITAAVDRDDRFTAARRGGWPPRWPRLGFERPDGSPLAVVIGDRRVTTIPTEALPSAPLDRVPLSVVD
jgi:alpha-glucosidase